MPLVNVKLIEGVFSDEQKNEIVDWGIGGQALTTDHVKALAAGVPA